MEDDDDRDDDGSFEYPMAAELRLDVMRYTPEHARRLADLLHRTLVSGIDRWATRQDELGLLIMIGILNERASQLTN